MCFTIEHVGSFHSNVSLPDSNPPLIKHGLLANPIELKLPSVKVRHDTLFGSSGAFLGLDLRMIEGLQMGSVPSQTVLDP